MHNLAIALHKKGYIVTGSDDDIPEPARSVLNKYGLLPQKPGWDPVNVTKDIDNVITGMNVNPDNPELIKAREIGLKILSLPEYLYELTKDKKRIVITGSHGKTTITAMLMHVFNALGIKFDFMVGSQVHGFESLAGLSDDSQIAVFEGDECLTSALDNSPKFHLYLPDIAVINGISRDHMNVFPTFESYLERFRIFTGKISSGGILLYFEGDTEVKKIAAEASDTLNKVPYKVHGYFQNKTGFYAATHNRVIPVKVFGEHNMQNLTAAKEVCMATGVTEDDFYAAIQSFEGISGRLQKLKENEKGLIFLDIANSPFKVKASVDAISSRYPGREIIVCLELHTYSGMNTNFLHLFEGIFANATTAVIYFNSYLTELKESNNLSKEVIINAFGGDNIMVYDNTVEMYSYLKSQNYCCPVYLFMSSDDFDGSDIYNLLE